MNKFYDVAITGAGPGGARAAIACAQAGLKTVILEKKKTVGEPVHCGECLSEYALENSGLSLPEHVVSTRVKGVRVIFPNGSAKKLIENGYILHKEKFEQWMVQTACEKGATLHLNSRVTNLARDNGAWEIETASGKKLQSKILIDASGVLSLANRLLKLTKPFRTISGFQYHVDGFDTNDFINFYLWPEFVFKGYLWVIPKGDNTCNVGLISENSSDIRQRLDNFIKTNNFRIIKTNRITGGRLPASGPLYETYGEGLMIIGDAAGFTSPLFEGGTHLAVKSGCIAAHIAKKAVELNNFSKELFSLYQKEWKKKFPPYKKLLRGKKLYFDMPNDQLNLLAGYIPEEMEEFSIQKKIRTGLLMLLRNPGLIKKGSIPIMKAFEYSRAIYYGW